MTTQAASSQRRAHAGGFNFSIPPALYWVDRMSRTSESKGVEGERRNEFHEIRKRGAAACSFSHASVDEESLSGIQMKIKGIRPTEWGHRLHSASCHSLPLPHPFSCRVRSLSWSFIRSFVVGGASKGSDSTTDFRDKSGILTKISRSMNC